MDLAGSWRFEIDRDQVGEKERWYERQLTGSITLPGSMAENFLGDDPGPDTKWVGRIMDADWKSRPQYQQYLQPDNFKFPFWLTPAKHYIGHAWYQRTITIPEEWAGRYLELNLERAHWKTTVWWDSAQCGSHDSLSVPHRYQLGAAVPGTHTLTICIDNNIQVPVGVDAHSITDHTQTNWNGVVGRLELLALPPVYIANVQVYPDMGSLSVRLVVTLQNATGNPARGNIRARVHRSNGAGLSASPAVVSFHSEGPVTAVEMIVQAPSDVRAWDEFAPVLYNAHLELEPENSPSSIRTVTFGFREFRPNGTQFTLNGRPIFLRGTLECCVFPLTGYPAMDVAAWRRIMLIIKAHGLNHLRFHSWCPPEAAFVAADEEGVLLAVECASWAVVGDNADYDAWLFDETDRILETYGNHPSFCMFHYGNEPFGDNYTPFLARYVHYCREKDPRRLYSAGAAWPLIPENDFQIPFTPRIQRWAEGLDSRINALPPETTTDYRDDIATWEQPAISHEIGQWCVYPNFEERSKYTGVLRALNFDIFEDSLTAKGMRHQARDFMLASGHFQAIQYKEEIEAALRTPGMAGYQLLDLHDFPGQGTALVGVLDPFWDEKGYITAAQFKRFAGPTVLLARLPKRVFTSDESVTASLEIAHFGTAPIRDTAISWSLRIQDETAIATGTLPHRNIPLGNHIVLGDIEVPLSAITQATKLVLHVSIEDRYLSNSWDLWAYPADLELNAPDDILVSTKLDSNAINCLRSGGKVLLLPAPSTVHSGAQSPVPPGFSSIFWNTAWTQGHPPHTLGILCDPDHPALTHFPTDFHSNWQWWYAVYESQIMVLDDLPTSIRPIVQVIDDWTTNRKLALVFEAQVKTGRLLVCSSGLKPGASTDPVRHQLLYSLLRYMETENFAPLESISMEELTGVIRPG